MKANVLKNIMKGTQLLTLCFYRIWVIAFVKYWTFVSKAQLIIWGGRVGYGFTCKGRIIIRNRGSISIGNNVILSSGSVANLVGCGTRLALQCIGTHSQIRVGDNVGISNSVLIAREKIEIGDFTMIGGGTVIYDNDFHQIKPEARLKNEGAVVSSSVIIGKHVWVGGHTIILKGVNIGDGSIIGAGSVVTRSIPSGVIAAGNPARVIRKI